MKLSHSKLSTLLNCPMTYKLKYIEDIQPIVEKTAFNIGSAVHWGLEHNTSNLDGYYEDNGKFGQGYTQDQFLAETMVECYLRKKEQFMKEILTDEETGEVLELLREDHEVWVTGLLPSYKYNQPHKFIGIIDLRLLTNKGYIIIDYKTSTYEPHWDDYLDQIYRYIFMSETSEPDIPVIKCGIINLRKKALRQKKDENEEQFKLRFKKEYEADDDNLVVLHMFPRQKIDKNLLELYVDNLSKMADTGQMISDSQAYFINYSAANGQYGKSEYWNIFYKVPDCENSYTIGDYLLSYHNNRIEQQYRRICKKLDMKVIDEVDCLNHYWKYKEFREKVTITDEIELLAFFDKLRSLNFLTDEELLNKYEETFLIEKTIPIITDFN